MRRDGFAGGLDRRQEQGQEYANDRDDDQELDQGERSAPGSHRGDPPGYRDRNASGQERGIGSTSRRVMPRVGMQLEPETIAPASGHIRAQLRPNIVDVGEAFDHRAPGALGLALARRRLNARAGVDPDPVRPRYWPLVPRDGERSPADRRTDGRTRLVRRRLQVDRSVAERLAVQGNDPRDRLPIQAVARTASPGHTRNRIIPAATEAEQRRLAATGLDGFWDICGFPESPIDDNNSGVLSTTSRITTRSSIRKATVKRITAPSMPWPAAVCRTSTGLPTLDEGFHAGRHHSDVGLLRIFEIRAGNVIRSLASIRRFPSSSMVRGLCKTLSISLDSPAITVPHLRLCGSLHSLPDGFGTWRTGGYDR